MNKVTPTPNANENPAQTAPIKTSYDTKKYDNKRAKLQVYNDIDREYFKSDKPTNPNDFIEKD